jgi:uncharacterized membrane protein required for colicin V production
MDNLSFTPVDIGIGVLIVFFLIYGFAKGAIRQFFGIVALVLATFASIIIPNVFKIPDIEGLSPVWKYVGLSVLIWIPAFLIFNSIGKFIAKKMAKKGPTFSDRIWGAIFGSFKGILIIIIVIFLLDTLPLNVQNSIPFVSKVMNESKIVSVIRPFNPILKIQIMEGLQSVIAAVNDPDYLELLKKDSAFQQLKSSDAVQRIMNDADLKRAIEGKNYLRFFSNPKIQELIEDQETLKLLLSTDIDKSIISNI